MSNIGKEIAQAAQLLKDGFCVAVPTETVYGLAADGTNEEAILKIFFTKQRPQSNPLILHFPTIQAIEPFIEDFPEKLQKLASFFWPGPLTLLLPKSALVPAIVTAGNERVAVRVPKHPMFRELLAQLTFPLAAPSANKYGSISPTQAAHVQQQFGEEIPYILDGGTCENGLESTIIGMENETVVVYRLGSIPIEAIAEVLKEEPLISTNHNNGKVLASGMVKHHYAPNTPLYFFDEQFTFTPNDGFIFFEKNRMNCSSEQVIVLSKNGNLTDAAANLYAALHQMDKQGFQRIFIEKFPNVDLGRTINDRLSRATAKYS